MRPPRCYIVHLTEAVEAVALAVMSLDCKGGVAEIGEMAKKVGELKDHIANCEVCESP